MLSTGQERGGAEYGILQPVIDVLPAALAAAAASVRSVADDLDQGAGVRPTGSAQLDEAVRRFVLAGALTASFVADALREDAADLERAASEYAEVDSLLVPRSLR